MTRLLSAAPLVLACVGLLLAPGEAQAKGKGHHKHKPKQVYVEETTVVHHHYQPPPPPVHHHHHHSTCGHHRVQRSGGWVYQVGGHWYAPAPTGWIVINL